MMKTAKVSSSAAAGAGAGTTAGAGAAGAGGKTIASSRKEDVDLEINISDDYMEAALRILDRLSRDKVGGVGGSCSSCAFGGWHRRE